MTQIADIAVIVGIASAVGSLTGQVGGLILRNLKRKAQARDDENRLGFEFKRVREDLGNLATTLAEHARESHNQFINLNGRLSHLEGQIDRDSLKN